MTECDYHVSWFPDLPARWLHHRFATGAISDATFARGYHASSMMTGWRQFGETDLLFKPCEGTEFKDAAEDARTRSFISEVWDEHGTAPYGRDPRGILAKIVTAAAADGWRFQIGPEIEGYLFDEVRWGLRANECFYRISEPESVDNARESSNPQNRGLVLTHPSHHLAPTADYGQKFRSRMVEMMIESGMHPLHCLHEAGPSQFEIGIRHDDPVKSGDNVQLFRRLARACGTQGGKVATFMPMPLAFGPGSGMHINLSMWKDGRNAFHDGNGVSHTCMSAVAGIMKHARALAAWLSPTSNSYLRLMHLYRADMEASYGFGNQTGPHTDSTISGSESSTRCPAPWRTQSWRWTRTRHSFSGTAPSPQTPSKRTSRCSSGEPTAKPCIPTHVISSRRSIAESAREHAKRPGPWTPMRIAVCGSAMRLSRILSSPGNADLGPGCD